MTTRRIEVRFTDDVAAQDPDEPSDRIGVLTFHDTSEIASWSVNGKERCLLTFPELGALLDAAGQSDEGEGGA